MFIIDAYRRMGENRKEKKRLRQERIGLGICRKIDWVRPLTEASHVGAIIRERQIANYAMLTGRRVSVTFGPNHDMFSCPSMCVEVGLDGTNYVPHVIYNFYPGEFPLKNFDKSTSYEFDADKFDECLSKTRYARYLEIEVMEPEFAIKICPKLRDILFGRGNTFAGMAISITPTYVSVCYGRNGGMEECSLAVENFTEPAEWGNLTTSEKDTLMTQIREAGGEVLMRVRLSNINDIISI